jgi:thioredoxin-related protein
MKRLLYVFLFMPLVVMAQNIGINFEQQLTWEQIKEKAKAENKFIFVAAYATWCIPCKQMEAVYKNEQVGKILNDQFISVKVQMDETTNDDDRIKKWYYVAGEFKEQYKPEGFPCYLFFSPEGRLVHKDIGLKAPDKFIGLATEALLDPVGKYENLVCRFKEGNLAYAEMPQLARTAKKKKQNDLAISIAKTYKEKYLDQLPKEDAFLKDNLLFLADFAYDILTSNDRYFQFFYNHGGEADIIMDIKEWDGKTIRKTSKIIVSNIIIKEEIAIKIYKDGKPITRPKPNWKKIYNTICQKYNCDFANNFFPDQQIWFYQAAKDFINYAFYVEKKMKKYPPKPNGTLFGGPFGDSYGLNYVAWQIFENITNKKLLEKALSWIDLGIQLVGSSVPPGYIDTKANLLYKLGRVKEAIELEEKAVILSAKKSKEFKEVVEKMKQGLPTWPVKE